MDRRALGYCAIIVAAAASLAFLMSGQIVPGLVAGAIVLGLLVVEPSDPSHHVPRGARSRRDDRR